MASPVMPEGLLIVTDYPGDTLPAKPRLRVEYTYNGERFGIQSYLNTPGTDLAGWSYDKLTLVRLLGEMQTRTNSHALLTYLMALINDKDGAVDSENY